MNYVEEKHALNRRDYPILGDPSSYILHEADVFLCALDYPVQRQKYVEPLLDKGAEFVRLVHPLAVVSVFISVGLGRIIGAYVSLSIECYVGQHAIFSHSALLG